MAHYLSQDSPQHLTPEQQDARDERLSLIGSLRAGDSNGRAQVGAAIRSGTLTPKSGMATLKRGLVSTSDIDSFKRLTAQQAVTVWSLGTEEETSRWGLALVTKIARARQNGQQVPIPVELVK